MAVTISLAITQNSQSVANNTSNVTVTAKAHWTHGSYNAMYECTGSITIDGTAYSFSGVVFNTGQTTTGSCKIMEKTVNVSHASDGTKTLNCSASFNTYLASSGTQKASASKTLTTIPRKSTLSVANGTLGTAQTLTVTRKSTSFTHTITATCGDASTTICSKSSDTSISFTPPIAWASQNTTGVSVAVKYTITTYNGSTSAGSNSYSKTCSIPASVKPSCTVAISDPTGYLAKYGGYIKGKSKFQVTVTPKTSYGSAIASYSITANGSTYTNASFTTGYLKSSGTLKVNATVKDKRGRSGTASATATVLNYSVPNVTKLTVGRCDEDGTANDQGEHVKVVFSGTVTSLSNKNTAKYTLRYKKSSASTYTDIALSDYTNTYSVSNITRIFAADTGSSYDVQVVIEDDFGSTTSNTSASTAFTLMHFRADGTGMGIGKIAELQKLLDIGIQARFYGGILQPVLKKGADLNDILTPNTYTGDAATTSEYLNCPISTATSFTLEVMSAGTAGQIMQRFTSCTKNTPVVYIRHYYSSAWGSWIQIF